MPDIQTLDALPGEGTVTIIQRTKVRRSCDECGEDAHWKQSYLLEGYRSNPASKAYRKDDCSWCSDYDAYSCREHKAGLRTPPHGYVECSLFPATERFAHLFLKTVEKELAPQETPK